MGRAGGTETFRIGIALGGGILGGGGRDMVGGRVLSTCVIEESEEDVISSEAAPSCLRSALPLIDALRSRPVEDSRAEDFTTLAARASEDAGVFTGDEGINWNCCAAPPRWKVRVLDVLVESAGGLQGSVCMAASLISGFGGEMKARVVA